MSTRSKYIKSQWRSSKRFFVFFPFWVALIAGINIWNDAQSGKPFNLTNVAIAAGMIAFSAIVFLFCRLVFKFILAWVSHEDRRA